MPHPRMLIKRAVREEEVWGRPECGFVDLPYLNLCRNGPVTLTLKLVEKIQCGHSQGHATPFHAICPGS